jgi:predicted LPLAT superfamily acyltransferase
MNFAESIYDRIAAWTGKITLDDVTFTGREALVEMIDAKRGALLITAHLGSFEVCRAMAHLRGSIRLNVLVHTANAEKFNRVMRSVSPEHYVELIEVSELDPSLAIRLRQKINAGELIVITGDRIPVKGTRATVTQFLGRPARFPQGPFVLASLLKCPVYTLICLSEGRRFHVYLEQICDRVLLRRGNREDDLKNYVGQFARRLERYCRRAPLQWFNFYPFWYKP